MHNHYCDGKGTLPEYVAAARELGMPAMGFSSHAPVPFECVWCMKAGRLAEYLSEVDALKVSTKDIELYKGLEIDFIPGVISPRDFEQRLDYTIGSIHFVDVFPDGRPWEIDGLHTLFLDGLATIFNNDIHAVIRRYYELTRQMVQMSAPDVIGHLDKIKIQNIDNKFYSENDAWYADEIDRTIDVIAASGSIVEVNTRGLYQKKSTTPYPSPWILERLHARRVPITLSSDAHHMSDITNRFNEVAKLLLDIGFKQLNVLLKGKWQPVSFNAHGISA
ncbi:histidinol-phosphatase [Chryseolinea sp. T2]|uniref:histidinol-phosphatase n=1 Tax=Chryseolinea sp. T2 TaxID=3129255 RepID=UPI0030784A9D